MPGPSGQTSGGAPFPWQVVRQDFKQRWQQAGGGQNAPPLALTIPRSAPITLASAQRRSGRVWSPRAPQLAIAARTPLNWHIASSPRRPRPGRAAVPAFSVPLSPAQDSPLCWHIAAIRHRWRAGSASTGRVLPPTFRTPLNWRIAAVAARPHRGAVISPRVSPAAPARTPLNWHIASSPRRPRPGRVARPALAAPPPVVQASPLSWHVAAVRHRWRGGRAQARSQIGGYFAPTLKGNVEPRSAQLVWGGSDSDILGIDPRQAQLSQ